MEDWKLAIEKYKRIPENDILRIFSFSIEQPINIKKIIYVCLILREEIIYPYKRMIMIHNMKFV